MKSAAFLWGLFEPLHQSKHKWKVSLTLSVQRNPQRKEGKKHKGGEQRFRSRGLWEPWQVSELRLHQIVKQFYTMTHNNLFTWGTPPNPLLSFLSSCWSHLICFSLFPSVTLFFSSLREKSANLYIYILKQDLLENHRQPAVNGWVQIMCKRKKPCWDLNLLPCKSGMNYDERQ